MNTRQLGFWETMCEIAHDGFNGTGMVLQVTRVRGPLREELVRTSLVVLARRHPLLRARLRHHPSASSLEVDEHPGPPPLRTLARTDETQWMRIAEDELCRKFVAEDGALYRVVLVLDAQGRSSELVMVFHHVISDGISVMRFASDLLSLCAAAASGTETSAGPPLPMLPAVEDLLPGSRSWAGFLARQVLDVALGPKPAPIGYADHAPIEARRTRSIYRVVSETQLSRLAQRCQEERTTIGGSLNAALMVAAAEVFGIPSPSKANVSSAVSLRKSCAPEIGTEHFGCYVTVLLTKHTIDPARSFWELSRDCREQLDGQMRARRFQPKKFSKGLLTTGARNVLQQGDRRRQFTMGYVVSNLGRLDLPQRHGPFHVEEMHFGTSRHAGDYALGLNVVTVFDRMFCAFGYESPLVSEASANRIVDRVIGLLDEVSAAPLGG